MYRWCEQNPKEILSSVYHCIEQTIQSCKDLQINPADIKGKHQQKNKLLFFSVLLNNNNNNSNNI